jgi:hypothetical protein
VLPCCRSRRTLDGRRLIKAGPCVSLSAFLPNAANSKLHYDQYFSMLPTGPEPQKAFSRGFFELAAGTKPRPKTVAIVAADAEFAQNAADGARQTIAEVGGFEIVSDRKRGRALEDER